MRKLYFSLLVFLTASLLAGCQRRELEDEIGDTAYIPLHIDWSQSGLDVSKMFKASVWFYPQDGRPPIAHILQSNLTDDRVLLPAGIYSVIVFNESVELNEIEESSLVFSDQNRFDTFCVSTKEDKSAIARFYASRADVDATLLRQPPEAIASWSLNAFEVTWEMVMLTRTRANKSTRSSGYEFTRAQEAEVDRALEVLQHITPLPLTHNITVEVYIQRLSSAASAGGRLDGATGKILLSTRQPMLEVVEHPFEMMISEAIWDAPEPGSDTEKENGTLKKTFRIFNHQTDPTYSLDFSFLLKDSKKENTLPFDITNQVDIEQSDVTVNVGLKTGGTPSEPDKDRPIILPIPQSNSVDVGEWEDGEIVDIK